MKWLVLVLLLLNIGLFGFLWTNPQFGAPPLAGPAYQPAGVPGLTLLGESGAPPPQRVPDEVDLTSPSDAPEQRSAEIGNAEIESGPRQPAATSAGDAVQSAAIDACARVGPVGRRQRAQELRGLFADQALAGQIVQETRSELRHWVHLRGATSRDEARDLVAQLEDRGFTDYLILNDPDELHTISLGVFRNRNRSERLLQQLREAHFPAGLSPRPVEITVFWLEFKGLSADQAATLETLAADYGGTDLGLVACADSARQLTPG